jgi:hypothetical protein
MIVEEMRLGSRCSPEDAPSLLQRRNIAPPPHGPRGALQQQALRCTALNYTCQQAQREMEWIGTDVTPQTYIRELLGSNLGRDTGYPDSDFFVVYPSPSKKIPG